MLQKAIQSVYNTHLTYIGKTFAVSSVILAQFINTIRSSAIIGFDCYEYH